MKTDNNAKSKFTLPQSFIFHEDASHGWLEVPRAALKFLKLEDKISSYSYQLEDKVYLEEDQDMFVFVQAYLQFQGKTLTDFHSFPYNNLNDGDQSIIRSYEHYTK